MLTTEQKLLCTLSHLGTFVGIPIVAPLIVLLASADTFVKNQAKQALGFQIGLAIGVGISFILMLVLVGFATIIAVGLVGLIFPIIAMIRIVEGEDYSYPITGNFVRKNF